MCETIPRQLCSAYWLMMLGAAVTVQTGYSAEPGERSGEVQRVLVLIPTSTVSVFCFESPFTLRRWDDLTRASVSESALCFTTMLAQRETRLSLGKKGGRCAVSAVRCVRYPKPSPTRPVVDGPFQSQRCEFFLLAEKLQSDWLDLLARRLHARTVDIAGHRVVDVRIPDEMFLVARLTDDMICVSNHKGFLTEVLNLSGSVDSQRSASLRNNETFRRAMACLSPCGKFWGVRLFDSQDDAKDPTSIHNGKSFTGFCDPKAVFVGLELPALESVDVQLFYASEDSSAAMKGFPERLARGVNVDSVRRLLTVPAAGGIPEYLVSSMRLDLSKVVVPGMDEPSVLFLEICGIFGQGLML